MKENKLNYRVYHLVLRQLNGINKGVQAAHSFGRYVWSFKDSKEVKSVFDPEFPENETTIMLDGGTNQDMWEIKRILDENHIQHSYFTEPDLNNCLTAITVVVDERVWDVKYIISYGDEDYDNWLEVIGGPKNDILINLLSNKRLSSV